jgi:hypothetical protein
LTSARLAWPAFADARPVEGGLILGLGGASVVLFDEELDAATAEGEGSLGDWIAAKVGEAHTLG